MGDDHDTDGIPPNLAMYHGEVVSNADPLKLGRCRVRVPGIIDERSGWAFPLATVGGGSDAAGFFAIPKVGADVGVWFKGGDEDQPFYMAANWSAPDGATEIPTPVRAASVEEVHLIQCFETERWLLVFDNRTGRESLTIKDKATSNDVIEIDGALHGVTIKGTIGVTIESLGAITIRGTTVTINGRPVLPTGRPI